MRVVIAFLGLVIVAIGALPSVATPIVIADLAADYRGGAEGQTTTDVGLPGTHSGAWNYYADDNHEVNGGEPLLTFVNAVGVPVSNNDSGYVGNNPLRFWPGSAFPVITDGSVFSCCTPGESNGFLQVHPGDPAPDQAAIGNPILAIQYMASTALDNLILNYQLQPFGTGNTDYRIVQVVNDVSSIIVPTTTLTGSGGDTGLLSVGVSDMAAGDSIWFCFDSGISTGEGFPADDSTNVRLVLTQIPEPASILLVGVLFAVGLFHYIRNSK